MHELLLKDILLDEELMKKYNLTEAMIKRAKLAPPYDHPIIEYLAIIIKTTFESEHSEPTMYNQIKNHLKIG
ncbi:hypothetical protein [Sphingobacterium faecium]